MELELSEAIPTHPKLRPVEPMWVRYQGQPYLYLRDPMSMAKESVLIPQALAPLLAFCDGTRDVAGLRASLMLRSGVDLPTRVIEDMVARLDRALLLENGAFRQACRTALKQYREAEFRKPSHAGLVYPGDAQGLAAVFAEYSRDVPPDLEPLPATTNLVGIVCPHIDFARGHKTYAQLWHRAARALEGVELAIILGTDHNGGLGMLTPTRQSYATPLGVLPTERRVVDGLAEVLGQKRAFAEEFHHLREHSIELVSVWFHYFIGGRSCPVVPVLCGSLQHYVAGEGDPDEDETMNAAVDYLREVSAGRRTLVIAAADLAHVGPAFGDPQPLDATSRARLAADDRASITDICNGDPRAFFERCRQERDARKYCGLTPIYLALRLLEGARGESLGYDQCPADANGGSVVSIAGVLLYRDA